METAPLKSFATWARTTLIREVAARVAVVLAPASPERVEEPKAVDALEKAVNAAGGGDKGRAAVANRVAYIWFNRIIALRFMDANGYSGTGVVSPQVRVEGGQPEILAEAKRGNIDAAMVGTKTRDAVTSLLNGTRRSEDPQGEAYALLLADYCRHWNRAMPFMFEREGNFTELLIPANLLADDSVLNRAVKVLTKEVCQDVEVIGWLYQFYISERHDEVFADFKKNKKAGAAEIPAATQLFTPHWIVRYLVENSLGRLWMLNRPSSRLIDQMEYYIAPVDEETDFLRVSSPEELKVIDPACGSGHMLTYAFDLLYAIYEDEGYAPSDIPSLILTNNLYGTEIDPRAGALAAFALTMKARARQRTFFNKQVEPNVCVLEPIRFTPQEIDVLLARTGDRHEEAAFWNQFEHANTVGSLIQPDPQVAGRLRQHLSQLVDDGDILKADMIDRARRVVAQAEYLMSRYQVAVTNPPYMGALNMGSTLADWLKRNYPTAKQDVYGTFVLRSLRMVKRGGLLGIVTGDTWLTIPTFAEFRSELIANWSIPTLVHLRDSAYHADTFGANAAFVVTAKAVSASPSTFIRLEPLEGDEKRDLLLKGIRNRESSWVFSVETAEFARIPGAALVYQLSEASRNIFSTGRALADIAELREGLSSSDGPRFTRFWWEVPQRSCNLHAPDPASAKASTAKWFPFNKGGSFRKWYGNQEYLINWQNGGEEILAERPKSTVRNPQFYFRSSVSWSKVSSGAPSFRGYPEGFVLGSAAKSIFVDSEQAASLIMAICNSSIMQLLLAAKSPTMSFVAEDVGSLPMVDASDPEEVLSVLAKLRSNAEADWDDFETSWDFRQPSILGCGITQSLSEAFERFREHWTRVSVDQWSLEEANDRAIAEMYGFESPERPRVALGRVSLFRNIAFRYPEKVESERKSLFRQDVIKELISYFVGCLFGRYSLDENGLILADQGATMQNYLAKVPKPTFMPDANNVIPIVDGDWFDDDIVARFRQFLRVAFGEAHFEENLRFVTQSLGVKDLRNYFVKSFYKDHVQRYKKRPIYWLFSSRNGSFNALIYMHRYMPSNASTVLNEYLREYKAKLESSLQHHERLAVGGGTPRQMAAAQKEADRLRKVLVELDEYEHDVLYPLASKQVPIDLDDGVKVNYSKLGAALKQIPGLEASDE